MASAALLLREEEKGREGAAAQPPGLFCVGRLPLPVSAASAAAALSGCLPRMPAPASVTDQAWGGCFLSATPSCLVWGL